MLRHAGGAFQFHETIDADQPIRRNADERQRRVLDEIGNRIVTTPAWSISVYPRVTLQPGIDPGSWLMPPTDAAAHLVVDVRSLFDGSVSTFDADVAFVTSYVVTFLPGDQLLITAQ